MAERWHVSFHPAFDAEFQVLPEAIQDKVGLPLACGSSQ